MPATLAHIPAVFHAGLLPDPWRRELVVPSRTAWNNRGQYDFLNSDHAHLAFEADDDIIAQDNLRQLQSRWEELARQWQGRHALQSDAFRDIHPQAIALSLGAAMILLLTQPETISVDATPDASVFITATYATGYNTYLEIFLEPGSPQPAEAVVNLYAPDNNCIFAFHGTPPNTLAQTLRFLQQKTAQRTQI